MTVVTFLINVTDNISHQMSRLNSLYTDQFESLNARAKQLVSDAIKIFFDPNIPTDLALRARTEQTEFYNILMEVVSRI